MQVGIIFLRHKTKGKHLSNNQIATHCSYY